MPTCPRALPMVAARQAPTDPLDLELALDAANETLNAATILPETPLTALGPTAEPELAHAQELAYEHTLRNILEPRMVALLEATMWRHSRDPEFLLGALKSYQMLTGQAPFDTEFLGLWWQTTLPDFAPIDVFPTDESVDHQLAALVRMGQRRDEDRARSDPCHGRAGKHLHDPAGRSRLSQSSGAAAGGRAARLDSGRICRAERNPSAHPPVRAHPATGPARRLYL